DCNRAVERALAHAERGWPVFPCRPGSKEPATRHGFRDATTDPAQIRAWWLRWPDANLAIATGAPGPDVLDVDHHGQACHGYGALMRLKRADLLDDSGMPDCSGPPAALSNPVSPMSSTTSPPPLPRPGSANARSPAPPTRPGAAATAKLASSPTAMPRDDRARPDRSSVALGRAGGQRGHHVATPFPRRDGTRRHADRRRARRAPQTVQKILRGDADTISLRLRDRAGRPWDAWWDKRPPQQTCSQRRIAAGARRQAERLGWCPPLGLDGDELDEPGYRHYSPYRAATGTGTAGSSGHERVLANCPREGANGLGCSVACFRGGFHRPRPRPRRTLREAAIVVRVTAAANGGE
ncbi:MAG: bifunctional DNA primase/polymerase, partial [Streptosporangiaceae bacterium]